MRLAELNPHWVDFQGNKLGITFDCPHCIKNRATKSVRLCVAFHHEFNSHIEDGYILGVHPDTKIWSEINPESDTFDNLTLTPSIDCSQSGHWHGFIINGDVI